MDSTVKFLINQEKRHIDLQFDMFKGILVDDKSTVSVSYALEVYRDLQKHINNIPAMVYCHEEIQNYCKKILTECQNKLKKVGISLPEEQLQMRSMASSEEIVKTTKVYLKAIKKFSRLLKSPSALHNYDRGSLEILVNEIYEFLNSQEGKYASFIRIGILGRNLDEEYNKFVKLIQEHGTICGND